MNCKPGDLAAIKESPIHEWLLGRVVMVLHAAPNNEGFVLPDGNLHNPILSGRFCWVCEFPMDIPLPVSDRLLPRMGRFAPVPDAFLRPIRPQPDDAIDEVIQRIGTPNKEIA